VSFLKQAAMAAVAGLASLAAQAADPAPQRVDAAALDARPLGQPAGQKAGAALKTLPEQPEHEPIRIALRARIDEHGRVHMECDGTDGHAVAPTTTTTEPAR